VDAFDVREKKDAAPMNFAMAFVQGVEPQDEVEALLAAQMAVTHRMMMAQARRLTNAQWLDHVENFGRLYNQLGRTFTAQVEALKRYRTGGEQKVIVKHVTVNDGGQAIVGNVETGGRGDGKK